MRFEKIFIFFLLITISGSFNVQAATVSLDQSSLNVNANQAFDVNVIVDTQGAAIAGAQLNIEFDKSILNVNSITEGNLFKQNGATTFFNSGVIDNSLGSVINIYSVILGPFNISTSGTFITINMTAIGASGTSVINLSNAKISDQNGNYVALNVINGSISINSQLNTTPTPTPTAAQPSSSGGGSSGGGASGASGENYTNIELKEKYDLFIYKDVTTPYCFRKAGNPITCINITGNVSAGEINTAVEVLKGTSTLVNISPPDNVYKNINIWVGTSGFATPANIKKATVEFGVDKNWIIENNILSIKLMRYDAKNKEWVILPTNKVGESATGEYYQGETDSFSPFAITGGRSTSPAVFSQAPAALPTAAEETAIVKSPVANESDNISILSSLLFLLLPSSEKAPDWTLTLILFGVVVVLSTKLFIMENKKRKAP